MVNSWASIIKMIQRCFQMRLCSCNNRMGLGNCRSWCSQKYILYDLGLCGRDYVYKLTIFSIGGFLLYRFNGSKRHSKRLQSRYLEKFKLPLRFQNFIGKGQFVHFSFRFEKFVYLLSTKNTCLLNVYEVYTLHLTTTMMLS